ncbi:efflux RND transporter permease subunit [Celerinatantimonas sp. MCCC 1A17872]|uniref:efflux RND transporter permease subunit n=1 Tax=Celerinatantimonas sp. MCCC 1A17872 TaxID=3177514 RepID=UPI0038CA3429
MPKFFIHRPILAWVVAIIIMLAGAAGVLSLPVEQYPSIAPPSVRISVDYPGASAETITNTVTRVIEQDLSGIDNLLYISSQSSNTGSARITLTFKQGTDPDIAQVQVQNKVDEAKSSLPEVVQEQGIEVTKSNDNFLMLISLTSPDNKYNQVQLGNIITSQLEDPITQVSGVGEVSLFGPEEAMRIWLNPIKMKALGVTTVDVDDAVSDQNVQISAGQVGGAPAVKDQSINATITADSLMTSAKQFRNILLRVKSDGSKVLLKDVARVEVGASSYQTASSFDNEPAASLAVMLATGANAMDVAAAVHAKMKILQAQLPSDVKVKYPYETTPFVKISIQEVVKTLFEAIVLVFLVMYLFLQNIRATLIPTIVVPVALLGTFGIMAVCGFSINVLSMFAMVLAIGLLVDDAIVVVENVERIMHEEHLSAREATTKAMKQITGALIGITTVLTAVFIPMAFFSGSTGAIYRQFSVTIVSAMLLSVLLALTFTPALCGSLLKSGTQTRHTKGFFGWFNRTFDKTQSSYSRGVRKVVGRSRLSMVIYVVIVAVVGYLYVKLPTTYLPQEDQGNIMVIVTTPPGTPIAKTGQVMKKVQHYFLTQEPATAKMVSILGFNFSGHGQNNAMAFVTFKDWSKRGANESAEAVIARANKHFASDPSATIYAVNPPSIHGLGHQSGLDFELIDLTGQGHDKLKKVRNEFMAKLRKQAAISSVRYSGLPDALQYHVKINRQRVKELGLSISDVNDTLSTAFGSTYVNNYLDGSRIEDVYVQADAPYRMMPSDINLWYVRGSDATASTSNGYDDEMVPFSAFATGQWTYGPPLLERYNRDDAMELTASTTTGFSSGDAMSAVEQVAKSLPQGYLIEWTGQSYQERMAGSQSLYLYGISLLVVFLCLAGLYESWSIPLSVILVVPLGLLGALLAADMGGLSNDIYFKVGLLTTIGLSTKNAILIVEFAKDLQTQGKNIVSAVVEACRMRLRPILMTSLAFIFGVLPLVVSTGAGASSRRSIGTGVTGGMIAATILAIYLVPVFFVVVRRLFKEHNPADDEKE